MFAVVCLTRSRVAARSMRGSSMAILRLYSTDVAVETTPISKVLIANRGEIACRVMRTARKMGVRTVAVYSDADINSMHVQMADEAHHIGPAPSRESYLRMDKIIEVAKATGAQAIHPGYGFLSENEDFAELCKKNGIIFIGPPSTAIRDMGSKSESKRIMDAAGVPIIKGYHGDNQDAEFLKAEAAKIGYPVLIKAVMGGGGKGMRIVDTEADFMGMLESAKREALKSFGNDDVLVEKYVTEPRHIEVQVFCDTHGNAVYLFERDCSVQRRHQKIIEEAPADFVFLESKRSNVSSSADVWIGMQPGLSDETRRAIGEAACRAAKAVNYVGAGTVEFIMDKDQKFYFMEMNTRLQVEHPVSEFISGTDLVEWQLKVAGGARLPKLQDELKIIGHAFEARIYAESPENNFMPMTGLVTHHQPPQTSDTIRVDTGIRTGDEVSVYYDPMISKLIVHAESRPAALRKLVFALSRYQIGGISSNIQFLTAVSTHPAFVKGEVTTKFIDENRADLFPPKKPVPAINVAQAAVSLLVDTPETFEHVNFADPTTPWNSNAFRVNEIAERRSAFMHDDKRIEAVVKQHKDGSFLVTVKRDDGTTEDVKVSNVITAEHTVTAQINDTRLSASLVRTDGELQIYNDDGSVYVLKTPPPSYVATSEKKQADPSSVTAPMTGRIDRVLVTLGQKVKKDTPLAIMEAMKMEHVLKAPMDGVVERIDATPGAIVQQNALVVKLGDGAAASAAA